MLLRILLLTVLTFATLQARAESSPEAQKEALTPPTSAPTPETKQLRRAYEEAEITNALYKAKLEKSLIALRSNVEQLALSREEQKLTAEIKRDDKIKTHQEAVAELQRKCELLSAQRALLNEKFGLASGTLQHQVELLKRENDKIQLEIALTQAKEKRATYTDNPPVYLKQPLSKDGVLTLSDRCVRLSGPITPSSAQHISNQIQYYNNRDAEMPIFLLLDSPGGDIKAGLYILNAMHSSLAPVHVVVKSAVASMAALITALAVQSYAYPDAYFMHHQPAYFCAGKLREHQERLERIREVSHRLDRRLAKKMGISLKALEKKFYEKSVSGDWSEFAQEASRLKWVDHVVTTIRETGIRQLPLPTEDVEKWCPYCSSSQTQKSQKDTEPCQTHA